jgi:hypothetical protein
MAGDQSTGGVVAINPAPDQVRSRVLAKFLLTSLSHPEPSRISFRLDWSTAEAVESVNKGQMAKHMWDSQVPYFWCGFGQTLLRLASTGDAVLISHNL